ncbi:Golgi-specific brefeldin A-resistance guanine nucleotide exchange factor 1 [Grus japonensis]|uniref:Golgi-specific brefeldin A-resistance guanine nucleotide exchange factor 1 n=1 Tax=Grus japonensis TaxID=30415 RepID=A0ABC9WDG3_GRUJA
MLEQFMKNCNPWEGLTLEKPMEDCLLSEGNYAVEQGKSVRSPPLEEEGAAETMCDELATAPIPSTPVLLAGRSDRVALVGTWHPARVNPSHHLSYKPPLSTGRLQ